MRWPFTREIKPVLYEDVKSADLPNRELAEDAASEAISVRQTVLRVLETSALIREKLASNVIQDIRGGNRQ